MTAKTCSSVRSRMASEQPQEKAVRIASSSSGLPEPIPVRLDAAAVQAALDQRDQRIQALEALLAKLRQAGGGGAPPQNFNTMASKLVIVVLQELCSSTDLSEIGSAIVSPTLNSPRLRFIARFDKAGPASHSRALGNVALQCPSTFSIRRSGRNQINATAIRSAPASHE